METGPSQNRPTQSLPSVPRVSIGNRHHARLGIYSCCLNFEVLSEAGAVWIEARLVAMSHFGARTTGVSRTSTAVADSFENDGRFLGRCVFSSVHAGVSSAG